MKRISELFQDRAADCSTKLFLNFHGLITPFSDLHSNVQKMAGALAAVAIKRGSRVGLMLIEP